MLLRHAKMQIDCKGDYTGIREIRKHAAWYTAGYRNSSKLRGRINEVENYEQLEALFREVESYNEKTDMRHRKCPIPMSFLEISDRYFWRS